MKTFGKIVLYILFFFSLVTFSSYISFMVMGSKESVVVPDLTKKSLMEANKELSAKRLYLKIEGEEYNNNLPAGNIIRQDTPPNNKTKEGRTIGVVISKGPKIYDMPKFIGLNSDEARALANKNNIELKEIIKVHSDSYEKDLVISQRPMPEEKGSDSITLLVSDGPFNTLYSCPDFTKMSLDEVKALTDKIGLEIEFIGLGSLIVEQEPAAGSIIKKGSVVRLKLTHGEE